MADSHKTYEEKSEDAPATKLSRKQLVLTKRSPIYPGLRKRREEPRQGETYTTSWRRLTVEGSDTYARPVPYAVNRHCPRSDCFPLDTRNPQVIILRASLFTLAGYDVMNVSDNWVLVVTAGILSLIVGVDVSLMLMGFAHVRAPSQNAIDNIAM